ncbi:hypothetical protein OK016_29770 [Vibrio chagasii]|nr:hypothetical protein [Vibrio chagasii]
MVSVGLRPCKDTNGVIDSDFVRQLFHFMATGITPDMVTKTVGKGQIIYWRRVMPAKC